ncbi:hypothetical protein D3C87_1075770 [compost metagenome]
MRNDLGVTCRLEDRPALFQLTADLRRIDDISIRRHCQVSIAVFKHKGLSIRQLTIPAGGITNVSDRTITDQ